ncbi:MAG: LacI family transcriptional regulator [Sphingobacteriales bacterium]|nr:MAG: LacI family transcriptional regulator [Sphingobacteriales bacterium]
MDNKIPTIREIAKALNISISTVSRALSDHPRIGTRTKERVKALAKELNYEPNITAIFFKQKKTFVIGVILPYIREEFFSEAISGIETMALENNYTILFGQSFDDREREQQVVEIMRRQRVDGVIISLSKNTNRYDHLDLLKKYNIPVVFFDRVPAFENAHKVFCDIFKATTEMVSWLFRNGFRKIAFINGPEKITASKERLDGYIEAISKQKLKVDMNMVERTDLSRQSTFEAMKNLLALKTTPTAIISFNDYVHMDAVQYAREHGVNVNKDIVFVSYANLPITSYTIDPPIVSIEQFPYEQGLKAMTIMIKIINEKTLTKEVPSQFYTEEIPTKLVFHSSLG